MFTHKRPSISRITHKHASPVLVNTRAHADTSTAPHVRTHDQKTPLVSRQGTGMAWTLRMVAYTCAQTKLMKSSRTYLMSRMERETHDQAKFIDDPLGPGPFWTEAQENKNNTLKKKKNAKTVTLRKWQGRPTLLPGATVKLAKERAEKKEEEESRPLGPLSAMTVLQHESLLQHFRNYLEENFQSVALDFVEAVRRWKLQFAGAPELQRTKAAGKIWRTYIGDGSLDEAVAIPQAMREMLHNILEPERVLRAEYSAGRQSAAPPPQLTERTFDTAEKMVTDQIASVLWPKFMDSGDSEYAAITEEYKTLVQRRKEAARSRQSVAAKVAEKAIATSGVVSSMAGLYGTNARAPGWTWEGTPDFQTICVDIEKAKTPISGDATKKQYCLVTVDSRTLKSKDSFGVWDDHMEFPLTKTTQSMDLSLWSYDPRNPGREHSFLGYVSYPVSLVMEAKIISWNKMKIKQFQGWLKLRARPDFEGDVVRDSQIKITVRVTANETVETPHERIEEGRMYEPGALSDAIRGKVSKKKRRWQEDGFDLDLSYVTPRIVAMGYPSESVEGIYRNNRVDVQAWLLLRHRQAYKLYNLCSERRYDRAEFENSVELFCFDDHNPPPFDLLPRCCENVRQWLEDHPQNMAAIHCKAGKGRTGTVICCYLLYNRKFTTSQESMDFYAEQRTQNYKGVTIPSQRRYVHYMQIYSNTRAAGRPAPLPGHFFIEGIAMNSTPKPGAYSTVYFKIHPRRGDGFNGQEVSLKHIRGQKHPAARNGIFWRFDCFLVPLWNDVMITCHIRHSTGSDEKLFHFWLNTRFFELAMTPAGDDTSFVGLPGSPRPLPYLTLQKKELDKAIKDKKHKIFKEDFFVRLFFKRTMHSLALADKA